MRISIIIKEKFLQRIRILVVLLRSFGIEKK